VAFLVVFRTDFRADDFPVELLPPPARTVDFRDDVLREVFFLDARFLGGVFSPFSLASLMPIASACLRLVTFRPPRVLSVPCLRRRIALATVELAFLLYFLPDVFRLDLRAAMQPSRKGYVVTRSPFARDAPL